MLELYKNIKKLRKEARITQEELARRTGYTDRSSIARIEKGEIDLPQSKIKQFAEALGVTPGALMGWEEEPEGAADIVAQVLLRPELLRMVEQYLAMPEADQYVARITVASLAEKQKKTNANSVSLEEEISSLVEIE